MTAKGTINRVVDAIPMQYQGLFEYRTVLENGVMELDFNLNEAREMEYIAAMWKTVIFTDMKDLVPCQIVEMYDARSRADCFCEIL
jgi:ABC-type nitrate/sulfonate/bicarbonate transport system ATPase subunit